MIDEAVTEERLEELQELRKWLRRMELARAVMIDGSSMPPPSVLVDAHGVPVGVAALTATVGRLEQELDDVRNSLANLGAALEHAQHMAATYAAETETLKIQVSALRAWVKQSEGAPGWWSGAAG